MPGHDNSWTGHCTAQQIILSSPATAPVSAATLHGCLPAKPSRASNGTSSLAADAHVVVTSTENTPYIGDPKRATRLTRLSTTEPTQQSNGIIRTMLPNITLHWPITNRNKSNPSRLSGQQVAQDGLTRLQLYWTTLRIFVDRISRHPNASSRSPTTADHLACRRTDPAQHRDAPAHESHDPLLRLSPKPSSPQWGTTGTTPLSRARYHAALSPATAATIDRGPPASQPRM